MTSAGRRGLLLALICAVASLLLRAPRAGANAPAGRYTVSGTGTSATVLDTKTLLTWQQATPTADMTWTAANTYCAGVGSTLGGAGWRLPTVKELLTLVDVSTSASPDIDPTGFPGTFPGIYWSSTQSASPLQADMAWGVSFAGGGGGNAFNSSTKALNVRCVR